MLSPLPRRHLAALLATVALATALTACTSEDTGEVGDTVRATSDVETDGEARTVVVPTGVVTIAVGGPVDGADASETTGGGALRAPDDASVVPVSVDFAPGTGADAVGLLPGSAPLPTTVSLAVGDTQVELDAPYVVAGDAPQPDPHTEWVVLPGDGSGITLEVGFDGLTQRIDLDSGREDLGVAAGFADLGGGPLAEDRACPSTGWTGPGVGAEVTCTVAASGALPWAPGVGWAEDGRGWRLVLVDVAITSVRGAEPPGSLAGLTLDADLAGGAPASTTLVTPSSSSPGAAALRWVFPVEPGQGGDLEVRLSYATDDTAARVVLSNTVDLTDA